MALRWSCKHGAPTALQTWRSDGAVVHLRCCNILGLWGLDVFYFFAIFLVFGFFFAEVAG